MPNLVFRYQVESEPDQIAARADALLLEQTVELSRAVTRDPWVRENIVGEVLSIEEIGAGRYAVALAQPLRATALDPAQFLNVAFGNSSLQADVSLASIEPPDAFFATFKGPRFGVEGLRAKLGAPKRALTFTALKPMGLSPAAMASLAYDFAVAGLDIVKDDHGLADHEFCPFEKRVELCQRAVEKANAETGGATLYAPNLIGGPETALPAARLRAAGGRRRLDDLADAGRTRLPARAGGGGDGPADPRPSGLRRLRPGRPRRPVRPGFQMVRRGRGHLPASRRTLQLQPRDLPFLGEAAPLRRGRTSTAFPAPAGGIKISRVHEVLEFYGADTLLLVGGSLLETGDVVGRAKAFVAEVEKVSRELFG